MGNEMVLDKDKQVAQSGGNTPADMIRLAVAGGADLEKLEKLLALQERWEANEARKAYHKAMADFKAASVVIVKDRAVGYDSSRGGKVGYKHATLGNVVETITPELSKHGLTATFNTKQNGKISVTCVITHMLGHSETTTLEADADNTGSKNSIQALGSTVTYLQRYTLLSALGLATKDQDDDGQSATKTKITIEELSQLRDLLIALGEESKEAGFAKFFGVTSLEELPATDFKRAQVCLEAKLAKKAGAAK